VIVAVAFMSFSCLVREHPNGARFGLSVVVSRHFSASLYTIQHILL